MAAWAISLRLPGDAMHRGYVRFFWFSSNLHVLYTEYVRYVRRTLWVCGFVGLWVWVFGLHVAARYGYAVGGRGLIDQS